MKAVLTVYRREMRAYWVSPIPYVLVVLFAGFMGWYVFLSSEFFLYGQANLDTFFGFMPWPFIVIVPAITMRLWSEEARGGTLETLLTMPVRPWQLVVGKFLGAWTLVAVCLLATAPIPITVSALGDLDGGPLWGGYLGSLLMGGAMAALGLWISALTRHQIVAFIVSAFACLILVLLGFVAGRTGGGLGSLMEDVSVSARYQALGRGVLDVRDLLYFATFTGFFLYLNAQAVENRRYR
jgi:ABC-2 type transport system permease protein